LSRLPGYIFIIPKPLRVFSEESADNEIHFHQKEAL